MAQYFLDVQDFNKSTEILLGCGNTHCITLQVPLRRGSLQLGGSDSSSKIAVGQSVSC